MLGCMGMWLILIIKSWEFTDILFSYSHLSFVYKCLCNWRMLIRVQSFFVRFYRDTVSICFPLVPPIPGPIPDPLLNWVTELSNVSVERRWVLLTNLKAAASYQFRVSAVNSVGEGPPSEPSNQVMLPQEGK